MGKEQRTIEIISGLMLVILIIIMILLFFILTSLKSPEIKNPSQTLIINNYLESPKYLSPPPIKKSPPFFCKEVCEKGYLDYDSYSRILAGRGLLGNQIREYQVYVTNRGLIGGYFAVKFYLTDYSGQVHISLLRKYLGPKENKRFYFVDVIPPRYKYQSWRYEVLSETKASKTCIKKCE